MVKYLGMVAVVIGSLMMAQQAHARHGCRSCGGGYAGGGCPGGTCNVSYAAPSKMAVNNNAPPGIVSAESPAPGAMVTTTQSAPTTYAYTPARRGLFGRR